MALKIGILGTRGIPNHYGGFEQIAGYLSQGLVEKGHAVTVYNSHRHPYKKKEWNGVAITHCYDPEYLIGTAGQFIYDLNCILDARKKDFDIILMLGYTSSAVWKSLYPKRSVIITNMDGLEWKRSKCSAMVRKFLLYVEKLAIHSGDFLIADSPAIKKYLDEKYAVSCEYIPYGAERSSEKNEDIFSEGLVKQKYFLLMARMEPENNIEIILDGFYQTASDKNFIVVGNTANRFGRYLVEKYKNDKRIQFRGAIYDRTIIQSLISNCCTYFHGHSVGGTNPSLLEAMAGRAFIAAHRNPFNESVLNDDALFFLNEQDIAQIITGNVDDHQRETMIDNNNKKIVADYNWPLIVERYEAFFFDCLGKIEGTRDKVQGTRFSAVASG